MKPRAERPKLSETRATVTIGGASFEVSGRTAQLIAVLALHQTKVNEPTAGKLVRHFGDGQAKLELREALPSLWLQPD